MGYTSVIGLGVCPCAYLACLFKLFRSLMGSNAGAQDLAQGAGAPNGGAVEAPSPAEGAGERGAAGAEASGAAAERLGTLDARLAQLRQEVRLCRA